MTKNLFSTFVGIWLAASMGGAAIAADTPSFGKQGDPIALRIGYQPLYAEGWSALVVEAKELWKSRLPAGSTVEFLPSAAGGAIIGQMVAGKLQMGYVGDMPALTASSRPELSDIRMIAVAGRSDQQCNVLLVRKDAPSFAEPEQAVRWLGGKVVATPHGSCADRFARAVMGKAGVKPEKYFNLGIDGVIERFKNGTLDAATLWEPAASRLVAEGLARKVATGADFGEHDAALVIMSRDLMAARPDVYKAWLDIEIEAQKWLTDPSHSGEMIAILKSKLPAAYSDRSLWQALYGGGSGSTTISYDFSFDPEIVDHLGKSTRFLAELRRVLSPNVRGEAIAEAGAEQALKSAGLSRPIGKLTGQPDSAFKN